MKLLPLGHVPELDKVAVAACLSSLGSRIRPAIFISLLVVEGLSVFATSALGAPLLRTDISQVVAHLDDLDEMLRPSKL